MASSETQVHPTAIVGRFVCLPSGSRVGAYAIIEDGAEFAGRVDVWNYARVRSGAVIGAEVSLGDHVHVGPGTTIGDGTRVGNGAQLHHPAKIGREVFIGPNVFLSNDKYPMVGKDFTPQGVVIEDFAVIGACACIIGGVHVGVGAVVGANSTVTRNVETGAMVWGSPAKVHQWRAPHLPGTSMQHWGPICPDETCPFCAQMGLREAHRIR